MCRFLACSAAALSAAPALASCMLTATGCFDGDKGGDEGDDDEDDDDDDEG